MDSQIRLRERAERTANFSVYSFYVQITQKQSELYADFTAFLKNKSYLGVQSVEVCLT